jgi:hypothetical protein
MNSGIEFEIGHDVLLPNIDLPVLVCRDHLPDSYDDTFPLNFVDNRMIVSANSSIRCPVF